MYSSTSASRVWLEHFPAAKRSGVANLFHQAVRQGHRHPWRILLAVRQAVRQRLGWAHPPERRAHLEHILTTLTTDPTGATQYAAAVLAWESLPAEERDLRKAARAREYQREHMRAQAPTEKQIGYLRNLGYGGPPPTDRLAASELIDSLQQRKSLP